MSTGPVQVDIPTSQSHQQTDQLAVMSSPDRPILRMVDKTSLPRSRFFRPVYSWLETLGDIKDEKLGMVELHPDVFATHPRMDILHRCVRWQYLYRKINYDFARTRAEMRGGGRKPWPQKGTGRARHGSIRSPLWHMGGKCHGPRGPYSYYQYLPLKYRALGLKVALTVKHSQGDLHIVDRLEIPTTDPEYLEDLVRYRNWGKSVLLVDMNEDIAENVCEASAQLNTINVMPLVGLNVYSMLKHDTLVLTLPCVQKLENKLLYQDNRHSHGAKGTISADRDVFGTWPDK
ncbi:39S ribosomal protein L4, mitochondrial-like [Branchiostoma floridae]|uniref:Large ribosomal subunit protein uL4m n=2 Tax=Branchiostoma floridae TaxID=7739 RepID=A0A9J7KZB5_BRAFL|nr:39S ribosomal protein L4, mitochondrial-like [Branchiostoma floridae]